jgi:hypothetical protein
VIVFRTGRAKAALATLEATLDQSSSGAEP